MDDNPVTISVSRSVSTYNRSVSRDSVPLSTVIRKNSTIRWTGMPEQSLGFMGQSLSFQVQRATFLGHSLTFHGPPDGFPQTIAQ
jgi:hypothetical protein